MHIEFLWLLLALLPGMLPASAQRVPASSAPLAAAPDTAAAIHRLFETRRRRRGFVAIGVAGAAVAGITALAVQPTTHGGGSGSGFAPSGPVINEEAIAEVGIVAIIVPAALAEIVLLGSWGRKREQQALEAWQQQRLPPRIRRRLRPRFFRPAH